MTPARNLSSEGQQPVASASRPSPMPGDTFTVDVPIRWGDMDSLAHLNNVVYFRLMEEARVQLMRSSGVPYPPNCGMVLAHASCDFLRSITYPATVRVVHSVKRIGRSSADLDVVMSRVEDEVQTTYARARTVLVWMDFSSGTSAPWPEDILAGLAAHMTIADAAVGL